MPERRDFVARSEVQRRVLRVLCSAGTQPIRSEMLATKAHVPAPAAHRIVARLAARCLIRCAGQGSWLPRPVLLAPAVLAEAADD